MRILLPSYKSLYIQTFFENTYLSSCTGFIVEYDNNYFLLTNRHCVTGRDNNNDQCLSNSGAEPDKIKFFVPPCNNYNNYVWEEETIYLFEEFSDKSTHIWVEHPKLGNKADFVAFKLSAPTKSKYSFCSYKIEKDFNVLVLPSDPINVVGFPFGETSSKYLAIWSTGFLATEIDLDYQELPQFLIDCRSRRGHSGSPVIIHRNRGSSYIKNGIYKVSAEETTELLGIYSGRINKESDLGIVWKVSAIEELLKSIKPYSKLILN